MADFKLLMLEINIVLKITLMPITFTTSELIRYMFR